MYGVRDTVAGLDFRADLARYASSAERKNSISESVVVSFYPESLAMPSICPLFVSKTCIKDQRDWHGSFAS